MSNDLTLLGDSPFDAIRRSREDGSEYWSARDLMPLLGYDRYENFAQSINRANAAAVNSEGESAASEHFRDARKMVPLGNGAQRDIGDRHLTRHACYLVAMNGDPRKQEIADAQSYFALRTRQAELRDAEPKTIVVSQISRRELAAMVIAEADRADVAEKRAAELAPAAASWEQLADASGDYSLREAAQILNRDPAISTGQNRLAKWLKNFAWVDQHGRPYQRHVDSGRLVIRARTYDHPLTGESQATTQIRITAKGLHALHKEMGGSGPLLLEVAS